MSQKVDPAITKRYEILSKIGQGAYGHVWKVKDKKTSQKVALKKIYDAYRNQTDAQRTYRQIMYSRQVHHPNLVRLNAFHTSESGQDIYLNMQFVDYDLQQIIRNGLFSIDTQRLYVFYQIVSAVEYLHAADLVHRDLKPANILINPEWETKVCDFGLIRSVAERADQREIVMTENIATRWYRAPQILLGSDSYGKPVDIWSLGCILAEMLSGKVLFQGANAMQQLEKIMQLSGKPDKKTVSLITHNEQTLAILENMQITEKKTLKNVLNIEDPSLLNLISRMIEFNPEKRITSQQIKKHEFFIRLKNGLSQKSRKVSKYQKTITIDSDSQKLPSKIYKNLLQLYSDQISWSAERELHRSETTANIPSYFKRFMKPEIPKKITESNLQSRSKCCTSTISQKTSDLLPKSKTDDFKPEQIKTLNKTEIKKSQKHPNKRQGSNLTYYNQWYAQYKSKNQSETCQTIGRSLSPNKSGSSPDSRAQCKVIRYLSPSKVASPTAEQNSRNRKKPQASSLWLDGIQKVVEQFSPKKMFASSHKAKRGEKLRTLASIKETGTFRENEQEKEEMGDGPKSQPIKKRSGNLA